MHKTLPAKSYDISNKNTLGVKKARPSKVESFQKMKACIQRNRQQQELISEYGQGLSIIHINTIYGHIILLCSNFSESYFNSIVLIPIYLLID